MRFEEKIKLFGMANLMMERSLDAVEKEIDTDLGRILDKSVDKDEEYYPQFSESIRHEAEAMGSHYELFYCLEKSIRVLIIEKLQEEHGMNWWQECVPQSIIDIVSQNMQKEIDSGITPRSTEEIDFTTFGELGEIVRKNWDSFDDLFNSHKAFDKIMTSLNVLRGPIAHCSPLAADEVVRLKLTIRDWFRLME